MNTSALTRRSPESRKPLKNIYLKFQIYPQVSAVLPMRHIQEALTLPAQQLTALPNLPPCMLGLMNRRSRIFWVISLAHLLGIANAPHPTQQYNLIIIQVDSMTLSLAVQKVEGITDLDESAIQPPPGQIPASIIPYLSGCLLQPSASSESPSQVQPSSILLVLDAIAIIQSSVFQSY
jgi:twitching motility protein PilI